MARIWADDDMVELEIEVFNGKSRFVNTAYVGHLDLADAISGLEAFKSQSYGGIYDLRFGGFGCEYANGAFHARLHFFKPGKLYITSEQETAFIEFGKKTVASHATLYLSSEPALLDRFIVELRQLAQDVEGEALLEGA
jgi:hypothetical protein